MRTYSALVVLACFATTTFGQQSSATQVRMECRDLSNSGSVLAPNETLVNGMACHVVGAKPDAKTDRVQAKSVPTVTPATYETTAGAPPNAAGPAAALVGNRIVTGATVYIEPQGGFENYLAAALQKKNVPLVPVASAEQATYILKSTSEEKKAGWAKMLMTKQIHSDNAASVQMIDQRSGAIVFAYSVDKKNTLHGQQTTAEACAKHLKEQIEKK